jgi:hypothetical protein
MIFAAERDADVPRLRPHIVDADLFQHEQEQWSTWHDQQTAAEQDLMGGAENSEKGPRGEPKGSASPSARLLA